jgi:hypothetical protein
MQMQFNPELGKTQASPQSEAAYPYHDAAGVVVYEGIRVAYSNGIFRGIMKTVYRRPGEAGEFDPATSDVRFYQLPELNKALAAGHPIVITRDEPEADLVRSEGYAATCCAGGVYCWPKEHEIIFKGAEVHLKATNLWWIAERLVPIAGKVIEYGYAGPVIVVPAGVGTKPPVPKRSMIAPLGAEAETAFMTRVLPWPKDDEPGYVQLCWRAPDPDDPNEFHWPKKSVRSVGKFLRLMQWGLTKFPDSYVCTALQREKGTRSNKNTLSIKSLRMDADVKEGAYRSLEAAIVAVGEFCEQTGIPLPNAWVCSGGGLHVYWIGDRGLTVEQWQPYANGLKAFAIEHGLKCDHGVTAVPSHVLRIPGTFNSKSNQRRPVYLFALTPHDFDFATELAMLPGKKTVKPKPQAKPAAKPVEAALPFPPVKAECGWLRHAHDTGGIDQTEPLWRDALRCCIFLKDGERLIHELGNKHAGYDPADTTAKYDKAREYKEANDLGWPQCKTIHGHGCTQIHLPHFLAVVAAADITHC